MCPALFVCGYVIFCRGKVEFSETLKRPLSKGTGIQRMPN